MFQFNQVKIRKTIHSISRHLYNAQQIQPQILVQITTNCYADELQKHTIFLFLDFEK